MSNQCINWAWNLLLKPGPKLVLICLADMANDNDIAYPKQSTIAQRTGFDRSTVNRHIQTLVRMEIITQISQRYHDGRIRSSLYQLNRDMNFFPCADLQHGKLQHHHVMNQHNRIPHRDPSLIGGIH